MIPELYYHRRPVYYTEKVNKSDNRLITVVGIGRVDVEPDTAIIKIGVITKDPNVATSQDENKKIMDQVIRGLLDDGVSQTDIKTIQYTVVPQYDYIEGKQDFRGYEVRHVIEVTVTDLSSVGMIMENAVRNGVNYQQGLNFTVDEPEKYYEDALELSIINAQDKAENIGMTLNADINPRPVKVIEKTSRDQMKPYESAVYKDGGIPVQSGKLTIVAMVEATFEY
ncbi:hypothetical protein SH1V18_23220 [Vallitalea longa]|uniref:26 kDa periplasmic immunogenic protein n=1 Tax=Vallitalea longa TaxID=2936439 RepID=A0A9W5Y9M6_9FIRM|nr:SIMPL domain-containing protein [Vallitalea longa]GKX29842.1 hypothetical protein SH1V18_23220 [Vallitalea longa]